LKITTLIATYKRPGTLKRAISSALKQTYQDLQVSVFDDASEDETQSVVHEMMKKDPRVKYYCHDNNMGALANFKFTFQHIDTPFFSILSDDDILAPDFYKQALDVFDQHPEIYFVVMDTLAIDQYGNLQDTSIPTDKLRLYLDCNRINAWLGGKLPRDWTGVVFRKEVARIYLEMQDKYDVASDMRFLLLAIAKYPFAHLSRISAFFSINHHSFSCNRRSHYFFRIIQLSRFAEVFYDPSIELTVKNQLERHIYSIVKSINPRESVIQLIKRAIKYHFSEYKVNIDDEISESRKMGMRLKPLQLKILFQTKLIQFLIELFFKKQYEKRKLRLKNQCLSLQNGCYRDYFVFIKSLDA